MKRFLVLQVTKFLDCTYSTRVVFESDSYKVALDEYKRLFVDSNDFNFYTIQSITFPAF